MASRNSQIRVPSAGHFLSARSARLRSWRKRTSCLSMHHSHRR